MFKGKSILVTGGTGSFGKRFVKILLEKHPEIRRLIIFSRDELKQFEMAQEFPENKWPQLRFFLGDVRDLPRLTRAFEDVDYVIHAAALKQVPAAEYNPSEFIRTNINGAENIINAALANKVTKVIALSTDKAAAPINLYGATKLVSDKLFVAANNIKGSRDLSFSVVRYGNVLGSRGSVVPFFLKMRHQGQIPVTHPDMTRFNITLDEGVQLVFSALETAWGGEIFVPKIPSYKILDVAKATAPNATVNIVGIRPGEKLHEEMITASDSHYTYDCGKHFTIIPATPMWNLDSFIKEFNAKKVPEGFTYNSQENTSWIGVNELRTLIHEHIDPTIQFTDA
ncbi:MAG: UDP-N-acetylglucosamine 4,6-dehydratase (inverting) [Bdellovibrio sp.]